MGDKEVLSSNDIEFLKSISIKFTNNILCDVLKNYAETDNVQLKGINLGANNFKKGDSYLSSLNRFTVIGIVKDSR